VRGGTGDYLTPTGTTPLGGELSKEGGGGDEKKAQFPPVGGHRGSSPAKREVRGPWSKRMGGVGRVPQGDFTQKSRKGE